MKNSDIARVMHEAGPIEYDLKKLKTLWSIASLKEESNGLAAGVKI